MNIDLFGKEEQLIQLRAKIMQAEQERMNGEQGISVVEARRKLRERIKHDYES